MGSKLVEEGASTLAASSSPSKGASVGLVPLRRPKGFVVWFQSLPGAKNFRVIAVTLDADVPEFTGSRAAFSVVPVSADGQLLLLLGVSLELALSSSSSPLRPRIR